MTSEILTFTRLLFDADSTVDVGLDVLYCIFDTGKTLEEETRTLVAVQIDWSMYA